MPVVYPLEGILPVLSLARDIVNILSPSRDGTVFIPYRG
jgi:hypothetical protein